MSELTEEDLKESEVIGRLDKRLCVYLGQHSHYGAILVISPAKVEHICCFKCFIELFTSWDDGCKFNLLNGKEIELECQPKRTQLKWELINEKFQLMLSRPSVR